MLTEDILQFDPPENTPLGDCTKQLDDLRKRKLALKLALKNLVLMEEYIKINGKNEFYAITHPKILAQAKLILSLM